MCWMPMPPSSFVGDQVDELGTLHRAAEFLEHLAVQGGFDGLVLGLHTAADRHPVGVPVRRPTGHQRPCRVHLRGRRRGEGSEPGNPGHPRHRTGPGPRRRQDTVHRSPRARQPRAARRRGNRSRLPQVPARLHRRRARTAAPRRHAPPRRGRLAALLASPSGPPGGRRVHPPRLCLRRRRIPPRPAPHTRVTHRPRSVALPLLRHRPSQGEDEDPRPSR